MVLQVLAASALILSAKHDFMKPFGKVLVGLVVLSAVVSAFQYFMRFWSQVDGSIKQRRRLRILERREKAKTHDVPTL
jgi:uncharacterized protein (DUF2062 family)